MLENNQEIDKVIKKYFSEYRCHLNKHEKIPKTNQIRNEKPIRPPDKTERFSQEKERENKTFK